MKSSSSSTSVTLKHSIACTPLEDVQVRLPVVSSIEAQFTIHGDGCTFSTDGVNYASMIEMTTIPALNAEIDNALRFFIRPARASIHELNYEIHANPNVLEGHIDITRVPRVKVVNASSSSIATQLSLPDPTVIIYTTAGPIGPASLPLRSEMVAKELAERGETVMYAPTARVENPSRLDVSGTGTLFQIGQAEFLENIDSILGKAVPGIFICSSKSDVASLRAIGLANLQGWTTVYEVRDDLEAMRSMGFAKFYDPSIELAICRLVDKIIVVSEPIAHKFRAWGIPDSKITVIPNGVLESELNQFLARTVDAREKRAVYFGHLFSGRFDYLQIQQLARGFPNYEFRLYGPGYDPKNGIFPDNVSLMGQVTASDFFEAEADAEIGLLPFRANAMTFALSPLKLAQYYALGFKVVSSDIFQIRRAPLVFADNNTSLTANFQNAVDYEVTPADLTGVEKYLRQNQWKSIVAKTLEVAGA